MVKTSKEIVVIRFDIVVAMTLWNVAVIQNVREIHKCSQALKGS